MPAPIKKSTAAALSGAAIVLGSASDPSLRVSLSIPHTFKVDAKAGKISDLQLMGSEREAKGHGIYVDAKTLETANEIIIAKGGRLKGYATHNHAGPGTWYWESDRSELDIAGFFSSISIAKGQLVAGGFEFFDSFKEDNKKEYNRMIEMAEKTPDLLGLSVEVWGYGVFVDKDGNEYSDEPDDVELAYNGMPALRVVDIFAAAFVSDGAATDGLFAALGRKREGGGPLASLLRTLGIGGGERSPANAPDLTATSKQPASTSSEKTSMKILATLKSHYGADKAKLSLAMGILADAEKPEELTLEIIEAKINASALTTAQARVTELEGKLTTAEKDRDSYKTRFEQLQSAGHGGVNLGNSGGGSFNGDANPWAKATLNVSEQCRIEKADAPRAAQLKAAAAAAK